MRDGRDGQPKSNNMMRALALRVALSVLLNLWLVPGTSPFPVEGAVASAWATLGARVALLGFVAALIIFWSKSRGLGVFDKAPRDPAAAAEMRRVGYGASVSHFVETSAFAGMSIYAGWLGVTAVAGLIAMGVTSTDAMTRRLGPRWKRLLIDSALARVVIFILFFAAILIVLVAIQIRARRFHPLVEPFRTNHLEAQHALIERNVARIDFDQKVVATHDTVGVDVGRVEQRRQHATRAHHPVHREGGELADRAVGIAQGVRFLGKQGVHVQPFRRIESDGDGRDGRLTRTARDALFDCDGRWNAREAIHRGPRELFHELPRVRRHRIEEPPLAFREERVKGQRAFPGTAQAGEPDGRAGLPQQRGARCSFGNTA